MNDQGKLCDLITLLGLIITSIIRELGCSRAAKFPQCMYIISLHSSTLSLSPPLQFTMMSMTMFKEVFTELVEYLVERIQNNYALQILPNALLANSSTSATFASILLGFLLKVHSKPLIVCMVM